MGLFSSRKTRTWLLIAALCTRNQAAQALAGPTGKSAISRPTRSLLEDLEGEGLTNQVCQQIATLQLCSERASAVELALDESTLYSFRGLWEAGFLCYDMEFVATRDSHLIAACPERLRWAIEEIKPDEVPWPAEHYTVRQLREIGASIFELPTLDQFLREMHRRMVDSNLHSLTFQDTDLRRPWVFVRLDEGELRPELLRQIVATANRHRALSFLVLVFDSREQVEAMWRTGLWAGKVMRNFPANATVESVQSEDLSQYTAIGASVQSSDGVLQLLRDSGKLLFAKGVEDRPLLLRALQQGFSGVSTTIPVQLQQFLHSWRADCRAKDINPATLPDSA